MTPSEEPQPLIPLEDLSLAASPPKASALAPAGEASAFAAAASVPAEEEGAGAAAAAAAPAVALDAVLTPDAPAPMAPLPPSIDRTGAEYEGEEEEVDLPSSSAENVIPPAVRDGLNRGMALWMQGFAAAKAATESGIQAVRESEAAGTIGQKLKEARDSAAVQRITDGVRRSSQQLADATAQAIEAAKPHIEQAAARTGEAFQSAAEQARPVAAAAGETISTTAKTVATATRKGFDSVKETVQRAARGGSDGPPPDLPPNGPQTV